MPMMTSIYRVLLVLVILVPLAISAFPDHASGLASSGIGRIGEVGGFIYVVLALVVPSVALAIMTQKVKAGSSDAATAVLRALDQLDTGTVYTKMFTGLFLFAIVVLALSAGLHELALVTVLSLFALAIAYGIADRALDRYYGENPARRPREKRGEFYRR